MANYQPELDAASIALGPQAVRQIYHPPLSQGGSLLGADRAGGGPVRITHSLEVNLEEADGLLSRHDPVATLSPGSILNDRRVANRHRPRRDFPNVPILRARKHEIAN